MVFYTDSAVGSTPSFFPYRDSFLLTSIIICCVAALSLGTVRSIGQLTHEGRSMLVSYLDILSICYNPKSFPPFFVIFCLLAPINTTSDGFSESHWNIGSFEFIFSQPVFALPLFL